MFDFVFQDKEFFQRLALNGFLGIRFLRFSLTHLFLAVFSVAISSFSQNIHEAFSPKLSPPDPERILEGNAESFK